MQQNQASMAKYYMDKYGDQVIDKLELNANYCEQKNDLPRRNRLLRIRDQILLDGQSFKS
ncbi:MAG: hypothetical protein V7727_08355 [Sneathiella sp.]